uniref:GPI mannosyltransferase 1 n=1 Tax=Panagrolaimus sp. PS1159 TaxID=55785 RepID=A0AC35FPI6_9BILA
MSNTKIKMDKKELLKNQKSDELKILIAGFSLRLAFIFYAQIHDYYFHVNFTDIDYKVFSDAAVNVANGRSPFDKPTYRYTPFLAWLLVPVSQFPNFGKILFCAADIIVGWLLILLRRRQNAKFVDSDGNIPSQYDHVFDVYALWLFNPFTMIISARGNADSLVCLSVLSTLYFLRQKQWITAAFIHGFAAIHLRIYPIIFLPSIFLHFMNLNTVTGFQDIVQWLGLMCTVGLCYWFYGYKGLFESLLYHFSRYDIRHNFSPYFYPLYLNANDPEMLKLIGFGAFIPQAAAVIAFAFKYSQDLEFCWFLTTFAFVTLNKVSTSQYFVWYLIYVPLISNSLNISNRKALQLLAGWFIGQVIWLGFAYLFEFRGWNTLVFIWLSSLLFVAINFWIIISLIQRYQPSHLIENKKNVKKLK